MRLHLDKLNILLSDQLVHIVRVVGTDSCLVLALAVLAFFELLGAEGREGFQEESAVF